MKNCVYIMMYFFCSLLFSCSDENKLTGSTFDKTFITGYLTPENIVAENIDSEVRMTFKGKIDTSGETFDALSQYYHDLSYNRYTVCGPRIAVNDSISKIEIKTVADFDATHPAGSDITDLVACEYVSYYNYIQDGYKLSGAKRDWPQEWHEYSEIEGAEMNKKNLADISYDNTKLLAPNLMLKFKKHPSKSGEYSFNMIIRFKERELSKTFKCVF